MKSILVTGGAGYIGSHTCVELLQAGYKIVVLDNLCNAREESLRRVQAITGKSLDFYAVDIRDRERLHNLLDQHSVDAVIHFAGLKAVGESVEQPLRYYDNNVRGSLTLFEVLEEHQVRNLVFSSSATVYGCSSADPVAEDSPLQAVNPYGQTKLMVEQMLRDICAADSNWNAINLRYFNPVGAHPSGDIGEDPNGIPNNLTPYIAQVAIGKRERLSVWGDDYDTRDGTGVRDYIHVVDLAKGHVKALQKLATGPGVLNINLGTGNNYSVLELVAAFEKASGKTIPYQIEARRPGDLATLYANPGLARELLGWQAELDLDTMVADAWRWQQKNPNGYPQN
ncbi:MAG: UDP-glucose 4-epimerase GalE [Gammaproteobacteria bacterium]|nr:UDP-glucose 4-epimerase GalE [Gammaproteobacteria bacterium]